MVFDLWDDFPERLQMAEYALGAESNAESSSDSHVQHGRAGRPLAIAPPDVGCKQMLQSHTDLSESNTEFSTESHVHGRADRPLATATDRRGKQVLQFHKDLSERQEKRQRKIVTEQQIRQDEELAWSLVHQDLQLDLQLGVGRNNLDVGPSQKTQAIQEAEVDRRHKRLKQELQLSDGALRSEAAQKKPSEIINHPVHDLFFAVATDDRNFVGVGCIIRDSIGRPLFRTEKCLGVDVSLRLAEYKALIYGLELAKSMGLRRINAHGNRAFIYWEVQRQIEEPWAREQRKKLRKKIEDLDSFNVDIVSRAENEDAMKMAGYAAQNAPIMIKLSNSAGGKERTENCRICLETLLPSDMVSLTGCKHQFCFGCLSQHVENEISTSKVPIRCPEFADCARFMDDRECEHLISPQAFDKYFTRLVESAISDSEKVYCPFKGCSAMMYRPSDHDEKNSTDIYAASSSSSTPKDTSAECMECHRLFCVQCNVPWHANLTCQEYQALPSNERDAEDIQLLELAKENKWRKCGKCRSLIMLASGCFHMTCRCGNQFCYTCGTNYQGRRKMCSCPLFSYPILPHQAMLQLEVPDLNRVRPRGRRFREAIIMRQARIQQANMQLQANVQQQAHFNPPLEAIPQLRIPEDTGLLQIMRTMEETIHQQVNTYLPHEAIPQLRIPEDTVRPQVRRIQQADNMQQAANILQARIQQPDYLQQQAIIQQQVWEAMLAD
ncbi:unnamed protein product [Calypogeia fissa]